MTWLLVAAAALGLRVWAGRGGIRAPRREWRFLAAALGLAALAAGAYSLLRGAWPVGLLLLAAGMALSGAARSPGRPRAAEAPAPPPAQGMSLAEARAVLGVGPEAGREEILAAHARLIRRTHPDAGGTDGLAAHLNAARDRLLAGF